MRRMLRQKSSPQPSTCHRGELLGFCIAYIIISSSLQKWTDGYYEPTTLADIGLRVQLGHAPGHSCSNPNPCLETSRLSIQTESTTSTLITANATIMGGLAPTANNSSDDSCFPQHTQNPSHVQRSRYWNNFTCKTFRAKLPAMISIRPWRN
jgi:hypothetical protein